MKKATLLLVTTVLLSILGVQNSNATNPISPEAHLSMSSEPGLYATFVVKIKESKSVRLFNKFKKGGQQLMSKIKHVFYYSKSWLSIPINDWLLYSAIGALTAVLLISISLVLIFFALEALANVLAVIGMLVLIFSLISFIVWIYKLVLVKKQKNNKH